MFYFLKILILSHLVDEPMDIFSNFIQINFLMGISIPKIFPFFSDGKASAYNAGDLGLISGSGRSPGEGNGNPLQYSCLENPMDRGAWWATVHGVTKSRTRLSDFTSLQPSFLIICCVCSYPFTVSFSTEVQLIHIIYLL